MIPRRICNKILLSNVVIVFDKNVLNSEKLIISTIPQVSTFYFAESAYLFLQVSANIFRQDVSHLVKLDLAYDISPLGASRGKERHTHNKQRGENEQADELYLIAKSR